MTLHWLMRYLKEMFNIICIRGLRHKILISMEVEQPYTDCVSHGVCRVRTSCKIAAPVLDRDSPRFLLLSTPLSYLQTPCWRHPSASHSCHPWSVWPGKEPSSVTETLIALSACWWIYFLFGKHCHCFLRFSKSEFNFSATYLIFCSRSLLW